MVDTVFFFPPFISLIYFKEKTYNSLPIVE